MAANYNAGNTKELSAKDLATFFNTLHSLLQLDIAPRECPAIIATDDTISKKLKQAMLVLAASLAQNQHQSLAGAIQANACVPAIAGELLAKGESSGTMLQASDALSFYYARKARLNYNIRNAVAGPVGLLAVSFMVLLVIQTLVLPRFIRFVSTLGLLNSGLNAAYITTRVLIILVGIVLFIVLLLAALYYLPNGANRIQNIAQYVPFAHRIAGTIALARYTSILEMLIECGMLQQEAYATAANLTPMAIKRKQQILQMAEQAGGVAELTTTLIALAAPKLGRIIEAALKQLPKGSTACQQVAVVADSCMQAGHKAVNKLVLVLEPVLALMLTGAFVALIVSILLPLSNILG